MSSPSPTPTSVAMLSYGGALPNAMRHRLGQRLALLRYHMRLLNWWLFSLTALSFLGVGALTWLQLRVGSPAERLAAESLSRFVMEPGAGLLAGMLASSLIVGDPLLEITLVTRAGISSVILWRALLSFLLLLLSSAVYLVWSLASGVRYAHQQTPLALALMWLAPVLVMGMLGLLGALFSRNAALGLVIATVPLAASLFAYPALAQGQWTHPFLLTYTFSAGQNATDWWINRWALLGVALALGIGVWGLLHREESLLQSGR